ERVVGFEATNNQQAIKSMLLEEPGDHSHVLGRKRAVSSDLAASADRPVLDSEPVKLAHRIMARQAGETIVDGKRAMALSETVCSCCSGSSVHTTRRCTNVNDCNPHAL